MVRVEVWKISHSVTGHGKLIGVVSSSWKLITYRWSIIGIVWSTVAILFFILLENNHRIREAKIRLFHLKDENTLILTTLCVIKR